MGTTLDMNGTGQLRGFRFVPTKGGFIPPREAD
jgi:hypothetical protein